VILTRVHPGSPEQLDLDDAESRIRLLEFYRAGRTEWLRLNLVTSVTGSAAGSDGTSESLTSPADRRILGVIRELSDLVLVGASSLRAEGYLMPRRTRLGVLTATGDLTGHRVDELEDRARVVVICPASSADRVHETLGGAEIIALPDSSRAGAGRVSMPDLVSALRAAGFASIVCEGGPNLAGQLLGNALVDELCLTTSPVLTDVRLPAFGREGVGEQPLTLAQLMIDQAGSLFARWTT
jgi:riboflavin biosynthesis pyrimidine reductase